jgi:hypothetical protein
VSFDKDECGLYYKGKLVLTRDPNPILTLWVFQEY